MTRILLVDDLPELAKSVRQYLEPHGYEIAVAADARAALSGTDPAPDLAIVDIGLPDMDGLQLASRLRQKFPGLRVIMFTARPTPEAEVQAGRMNFYDFLPKSNLYDLLLPTVKRVLENSEPPERDRSTDPTVAAEQYVAEGKYELAAGSLENAAREAEFKHQWSRAQELFQKAADHYGRARGIASDGRKKLIRLAENADRIARGQL